MSTPKKERPILYTDTMVRAVIARSKKQTRRLRGLELINRCPDGWELLGISNGIAQFFSVERGDHHFVRSPYGVAGDVLYVREAWALVEPYPVDLDDIGPKRPDVRTLDELTDAAAAFWRRRIRYRADILTAEDAIASSHEVKRWKPSIHLPRAFSRLLLEVTEVRVERVQAITEADAQAEGVAPAEVGDVTYFTAFRVLWDEINGKSAPWASNPWVWVVGFRLGGGHGN